jgi:hypothetical protein
VRAHNERTTNAPQSDVLQGIGSATYLNVRLHIFAFDDTREATLAASAAAAVRNASSGHT